MPFLELLFADIVFRLSRLGWPGILDLILATIFFYVMLQLIRRSRAAFLLRGVLVLGSLLLVVTILLDLPTFDWLVQAVLLAMLVAAPVVLQPELRRLLERIGRGTGLSRVVRQTTAESVLPQLGQTVEFFSTNRIGALIVLEGAVSLQPYIDSGIRIDGRVTGELLRTIFHDKTPLHDGAVVLRGDQVVAASCVLPLTGQELNSYRRLGTRHRAAMGMSEVSDALVVAVSEETGAISIAYQGALHQEVDSTALRQRLFDFYTGETGTSGTSWRERLFNWESIQWSDYFSWPSWRQLVQHVALLPIAALLALSVWLFVIEQTNPTTLEEIEGIPLRVEGIPEGLALMNEPPQTVSAEVRTTEALRSTLSSDSFQAVVSLQGLSPDTHEVPVTVNPNVPFVQMVSVNPSVLSVELASIIGRTMPVSVDLLARERVSAAYEIADTPVVEPGEVTVMGPAPLVDQVSQVQATLSVANASATIREVRPLQALDGDGRQVSGVTLEPDQVEVTLNVRRRLNARDVGVRAITSGTPPEGYWLSSLSVTPTSLTLRGDPGQLDAINGFVDTLAVDISSAVDTLTMDVPLDLPNGVTAVDSGGNSVHTVTVVANVAPRTGDLLLTRPVELVGAREGITTTVEPPQVEILLSGPLPTLNEIEANPELVQVVVDVIRLAPITGQSVEQTPQVVAPQGVTAQLTPANVLVTFIRQ